MTRNTTTTPFAVLAFAGFLVTLPGSAVADGQAEYAEKRGWEAPIHDDYQGRLLFDRLEYAAGDDEDTLNYEFIGWYGGDTNRLWLEGEGEDVIDPGGEGGHLETLDLLYGRLISAFWDIQAGVSYEREYGPGPDHDRAFAVLGIQGLAPYWFETDANLRVSEDGDASADLELEYDWLLSQRTVLQPRFETAYAFSEAADFGVGKGLTNVKLGLRLRYEIRREFAPYVGVSWNRKLGDTADLAEAEGNDDSRLTALAGIRMWF
ncbi:copper resistance protein B [Thiohalorhabdus sp.]|uniref:copper resistance protein B n=1 Tax=Thiohalorhabdus sp. TaxID=3094134 RepID=UPI002FC3D74E